MGVVWEAERSDDLFTKRVAIKFVKRGMDSEEVLRRFRRERQILAQLEHPNIARLLDAGVTADGRPWFAMEFVEGEPLTACCRTRNLPERTRLALFREVCQAVHFAHRNLVVHRDLKPSNILVTSEGTVKLLDFGVARLLEGGAGGEDEVTRVGTRPMTPAYASPEQSQGQPVTTASDIYTLGVVLHELLTGTRPGEPRVPISPEDTGGNPPLSAELAAVVGMAVRPEPERRYASVAELDDDVARYLAGFPVRARPDTAAYRFGSFVRRNRMGVAAAALVGMALVAGGSVAAWQARVAVQERARAEARAAELRQLSTGLLFEVHDAISTLPGATATRELVVRLAFDHLARLAGEDAGDPALERDVARGYLRLASVLANPVGAGLADREGARAALEQAVEIAERTSGLRGEGRGTTGEVADDALALRAEALRRWGDFLAWEGEVEAGVEALAHSLDAYQRLAALRGPSDATAHLEVVIAHLKIGDHTGHPCSGTSATPRVRWSTTAPPSRRWTAPPWPGARPGTSVASADSWTSGSGRSTGRWGMRRRPSSRSGVRWPCASSSPGRPRTTWTRSGTWPSGTSCSARWRSSGGGPSVGSRTAGRPSPVSRPSGAWIRRTAQPTWTWPSCRGPRPGSWRPPATVWRPGAWRRRRSGPGRRSWCRIPGTR
jgi:eukaryotic-like serine/threonine-protein kinase